VVMAAAGWSAVKEYLPRDGHKEHSRPYFDPISETEVSVNF
jgi:hypothetical protein